MWAEESPEAGPQATVAKAGESGFVFGVDLPLLRETAKPEPSDALGRETDEPLLDDPEAAPSADNE